MDIITAIFVPMVIGTAVRNVSSKGRDVLVDMVWEGEIRTGLGRSTG
jgi:hypothetical protein